MEQTKYQSVTVLPVVFFILTLGLTVVNLEMHNLKLCYEKLLKVSGGGSGGI